MLILRRPDPSGLAGNSAISPVQKSSSLSVDMFYKGRSNKIVLENAPLCHLIDQTIPVGRTQRREHIRCVNVVKGQPTSKVQPAQNLELDHLH